MMKAQSPPQTTAAPATTDHAVAARPPRSWSKELPRSSPLTRTNFPLPRAPGTLRTNRPVADAANDSRRGLLCCKPNTLPSKATCWPKRPAGERSPANTSALTTITTFRWRFKAISHVDTTSTTCAPCGPRSQRHLPHQSDGDLTARGLRARMNEAEPEPTTYCDPGCGQTPEPPQAVPISMLDVRDEGALHCKRPDGHDHHRPHLELLDRAADAQPCELQATPHTLATLASHGTAAAQVNIQPGELHMPASCEL